MSDSFSWKRPEYYNVFIPQDFLSALTYLERNTPQESVVLTGELMSSVIPAFTHNRVILGRGDVVTGYDQKLAGMYAMFGADPAPAAVRGYLNRYRVHYVIFGTDTPGFCPVYCTYPFLKAVFYEGNVMVAKVSD